MSFKKHPHNTVFILDIISLFANSSAVRHIFVVDVIDFVARSTLAKIHILSALEGACAMFAGGFRWESLPAESQQVEPCSHWSASAAVATAEWRWRRRRCQEKNIPISAGGTLMEMPALLLSGALCLCPCNWSLLSRWPRSWANALSSSWLIGFHQPLLFIARKPAALAGPHSAEVNYCSLALETLQSFSLFLHFCLD